MNEECGFLYNVYAETEDDFLKFYENCFLKSYKSLKEHLPNSKVAIHTHLDVELDDVIIIKTSKIEKISKVTAILNSPFYKTIYLDVDVLIHNSHVSDIFKILDDYDFAGCYGRGNACYSLYQGPVDNEIFIPEINAGLLGVKKNEFTKSFLNKWIQLYKEMNLWHDQPSFRKLFLENTKNFFILPPHYNYRCPIMIGPLDYTICSHDISMNKDEVTKLIIEYYESKYDSIQQ